MRELLELRVQHCFKVVPTLRAEFEVGAQPVETRIELLSPSGRSKGTLELRRAGMFEARSKDLRDAAKRYAEDQGNREARNQWPFRGIDPEIDRSGGDRDKHCQQDVTRQKPEPGGLTVWVTLIHSFPIR